MSTYKVLQDIEAEDKLVGPLSLRQFIYAGIAAICGYLIFLAFSKGVGVFAVLFLPIMLFTGFFAVPWGKDQSTEIWALAKLRFLLKPRKRIWDQSGAKELVTITVPKHIERQLTNGLNQHEVNSRLRALADTIDSRGWAVKNVNVNMYAQTAALEASDRLVEASSLPQEVVNVDIKPSDDILDETANPVAHHFDDMITASSAAKRQELMTEMQTPVQPDLSQQAAQQPVNDYWFMHQPAPGPAGQSMFAADPVVSPGSNDNDVPMLPHAAEPTAEEQALVDKFKAENESLLLASQSHIKVIPTPEQQQAAAAARAKVEAALNAQQRQSNQTVTPVERAAIINASRNDDLDVATQARQMQKLHEQVTSGGDSGEVVISLR